MRLRRLDGFLKARPKQLGPSLALLGTRKPTVSAVTGYALTAVPQYGGGDGKLRIIGFRSTGEGGSHRQETWYDDNDGHPTRQISRYTVEYRGGQFSRQNDWNPERGNVHRALFDAVWKASGGAE